MKRALFVCLAVAGLAASTGCCGGFGVRCHHSCGSEAACGSCAGPAVESCGGSCGGGGCDITCDEGNCGRGCFNPLAPLGWVVRLLGCGCPCGGCDRESYWGDFYSDPPACHEPCDRQGNWQGRGCGCGGDGYSVKGNYITDEGLARSVAQPPLSNQTVSTKAGSRYPTQTPQYAPKSVAKSPYISQSGAARASGSRSAMVQNQGSSGAVGAVPPPKLISVTDRVVKPATTAAEEEDPAAVIAQNPRGEWKAAR